MNEYKKGDRITFDSVSGEVDLIGATTTKIKNNARHKGLLVVSSLDKAILIERTVVDSILSYAQMPHPKEAVLLLKGKVDKHRILVNDTQIPPLATHGNLFHISI